MPEPIIETERLILRRIDPAADFEPWAAAMADESTVRYLGSPPMSRARAWRDMAMVMGHWAIRGFGFFSLQDKSSGEWVGRVGPWNPEGWPQPEVGWTIAPAHRRKGYAVEAGRASIRYAFETLAWPAVIHVILDGNAGSIAVAEKLGSEHIRSEQGLAGVTDELVHIYGQKAPAR